MDMSFAVLNFTFFILVITDPIIHFHILCIYSVRTRDGESGGVIIIRLSPLGIIIGET
jgi:hypothetical protein